MTQISHLNLRFQNEQQTHKLSRKKKKRWANEKYENFNTKETRHGKHTHTLAHSDACSNGKDNTNHEHSMHALIVKTIKQKWKWRKSKKNRHDGNSIVWCDKKKVDDLVKLTQKP